ncbi:MAG: bifunctional phosphopantothenoylcysteine decarboxylase/phosphopantothenate--cysteine ligase CoaBC [Candidatus Eiseniibacteriota bacterium]
MTAERGPRILLGVTGSVAAFKAPDLVREFRDRGAEVACVMTDAARRFLGAATLEAMSGNPVGLDLFDARGSAALPAWAAGTELARMPYHLAVAECADLILVAPCSATTMAKIASGIADNLLTSSILATTKPVAVAPAMNTRMWEHPATRQNVRVLAERGVHVLEPDRGKMAWRDEGEGAGRLPEPADLAARAWRILETCRELAGVKVVVSAGGTEEPIDAVRVLTNRSSGRMGAALAAEAKARGADVVLVAAGMSVPVPVGIRVVPARSAAAMRDAMLDEAKGAGIILMAAAVSDWRPKAPHASKRKKSDGPPTIELEPTDDIIALLADAARDAFRVGFALETGNAVANGREKLAAKRLDLVVVNDATEPGAGFEVDTNRVTLLARDGTAEELPLLPKREVAARILDRVAELRAG